MPNVAFLENPDFKIAPDKIGISNYGEIQTVDNTALFFNDRYFPLFEPITIITQIEKTYPIKEAYTLVENLVESELDKMLIASSLVFGSRIYGKTFNKYIDLVMEIFEYFADRGIKSAVFQIREVWVEDGDLIERSFEVLDYKGEETGVSKNYSVSVCLLDEVPMSFRKNLGKYFIVNNQKFAGIYDQRFVLMYQDKPLNLRNINEFWKDYFILDNKENDYIHSLNKALNPLLLSGPEENFNQAVETLKEILSLQRIDNVNPVSLAEILELRQKYQKEIRRNEWEIEKVLTFEITPSQYPYTFNIKF